MVFRALFHICYVIRSGSDYTEVHYGFEFVSRAPLILYLGYMPSRGKIGGSPPVFLF